MNLNSYLNIDISINIKEFIDYFNEIIKLYILNIM